MKYVGFIDKIDSYGFALPLEFYTQNTLSSETTRRIILHLEGGQLCVPLMGSTENPFDPKYDPEDMEASTDTFSYIAMFTDGYYLWPEYFLDFMKIGDITHVDQNFIDHVLARKYRSLSEKEILKLEKDFFDKNWGEGPRY